MSDRGCKTPIETELADPINLTAAKKPKLMNPNSTICPSLPQIDTETYIGGHRRARRRHPRRARHTHRSPRRARPAPLSLTVETPDPVHAQKCPYRRVEEERGERE